MAKKITSLVLEGGGLRGAYTAGCLSWLIDNGIEFDHAYSISTGAVYLAAYLMGSVEDLKSFSTYYITDSRIVGLRPFLRCGRIVDYEYLFMHILPEERHFSIAPLKDVKSKAFVGLYELKEGKTVYHPVQSLSMSELQASTTLPILGKLVTYEGRQILDGGITDMIPIGKSVADGCNRHLVITTKPEDYVRKPAKKMIVELMKRVYPQCDNISKDYAVRHLNYVDQINLIRDLERKGQAVYLFPSEKSNVTRLGGSYEDLCDLYELGRRDMERRKDDILHLLND